MVRFGPAGNSLSFYEQGYKSSSQTPKWLNSLGLNAFEYQCNRGVKIGQKAAMVLGEQAKKYDIALSIHAPYYINTCSIEEIKRENSVNYMIDSMRAASHMGATRIVVHPGACTGLDRVWCLETSKEVFKKTIEIAKADGIDDIIIAPELMGKINQLGTLDEVIEMCKVHETMIPTIDFGHLNARTHGSLKTVDDFLDVFKKIANGLGEYRAKNIHSHFSHIEYTKMGEKKHLTFEDDVFGPDFALLAEACDKFGATPTFICESDGVMAEDAAKMRDIWNEVVTNG